MKNIGLIAILSILLATVSCCSDNNDDNTMYTVSFDTDGGTPVPAIQKVSAGNTVSAPATNPTKPGYVFGFWYSSNHTTAYNFQTPVSSDITLYAKWEAEAKTEFIIRNTNDWNNAVSTIRSGGDDKSYTLIIEGIVPVPPTTGVEEGKPSTFTFGGGARLSVTLKGDGTLALSNPGFLICLSGYVSGETVRQKLIIDGPTLQGRPDNVLPLLRLNYATLELKSGKITGNINNGGGGSGFGGGVYIMRGMMTMSGGEISNNTCGQKNYVAHGGGIALSYSSFNMSGGVISGNTGNDGGGIYMGDYTFTMTGGEIKGNTARSSSSHGGGIYITGYASISKTGGIIYGSDSDDANRNKTVDYNDNILSKRGAAVFCPVDIIIGNENDKRRETTLGEEDDIDSSEDAGWGI